MAYGNDVSVYVEDTKGDLGAPGSPAPWWLSPDVDIPAHSGTAFQGANDVQIRVHAHEEPLVDEKIVAEVYVGQPGFVLSPTVGTKRIDPGNLVFRPINFPGTEPLADDTGGTLTFSWTPSASAGDVDGAGHRCLIVRAFPQSVTPPADPFDVPNEGHEAQHNIEVLTTTMDIAPPGSGGWGTPWDPRRRDEATGLWWERFSTMAAKKPGKHFVMWAFDPEPSREVTHGVRGALKEAGVTGFAQRPLPKVELEPDGGAGREIDPKELLDDPGFAAKAGLGSGLFTAGRILAAAELDLGTHALAHLVLRFDLSDLAQDTAAVLHGVQWSADGEPEGGMTVIALAPTEVRDESPGGYAAA
jgi:hypothetical protein